MKPFILILFYIIVLCSENSCKKVVYNNPPPVHDTTLIHDTTVIYDTTAIHDTTFIHDTTVNHDTIAIHDTVVISELNYLLKANFSNPAFIWSDNSDYSYDSITKNLTFVSWIVGTPGCNSCMMLNNGKYFYNTPQDSMPINFSSGYNSLLHTYNQITQFQFDGLQRVTSEISYGYYGSGYPGLPTDSAKNYYQYQGGEIFVSKLSETDTLLFDGRNVTRLIVTSSSDRNVYDFEYTTIRNPYCLNNVCRHRIFMPDMPPTAVDGVYSWFFGINQNAPTKITTTKKDGSVVVVNLNYSNIVNGFPGNFKATSTGATGYYTTGSFVYSK